METRKLAVLWLAAIVLLLPTGALAGPKKKRARGAAMILCMKSSTGALRARKRCASARGEKEVTLSELQRVILPDPGQEATPSPETPAAPEERQEFPAPPAAPPEDSSPSEDSSPETWRRVGTEFQDIERCSFRLVLGDPAEESTTVLTGVEISSSVPYGQWFSFPIQKGFAPFLEQAHYQAEPFRDSEDAFDYQVRYTIVQVHVGEPLQSLVTMEWRERLTDPEGLERISPGTANLKPEYIHLESRCATTP